ncbi:hypothetical protein OIU84_013803 [Salix udensis]|uniref:Uncharacterized protein n=1 Tax=Salix udensis TaxID=889485 RepID=A0AAD6JJ57_9ROSI|nr:hypothetical protein OIU84_013803 [Salix udensis]
MPKGSVAAEQNVKKRERKICDFSGQKKDSPEERDPLRIFCETLFEQIPDSEMSQFWSYEKIVDYSRLMESGLLPMEVARKVYDKKQKRNKFISPVKAVSVTKKGTIICSVFNQNEDNSLQGIVFN